MVRLINKNNIDKFANAIFRFFDIQSYFTHIASINAPERNCIYALWHSDQLSLYGIDNKKDLHILISNSADGEIITRVILKMGFSVVRGSSNRKGCISSTLKLIDKLKEGKSAAVMVDGPRGPLHKVKKGVVMLAKETGVPIVPLHWYSKEKTLIKLPSWDKMTIPIFNCHILNLYGDPIYVSPDDDEQMVLEKIKNSLDNLHEIAPEEFKKAKKQKLWKK